MSKKQGSKQQKSLSASKSRGIRRKETVWTVAYRPGAHVKKLSIPLAQLLTKVLKVAQNMKEAKFALNNRKVIVDGRVRTSKNYPVGLFDIVELKDLKKAYRIVIDTKGRLKAIEVKTKDTKICKIKGKKKTKGNQILLSTNDGRTFTLKETKLKVGDSIKVKIPSQEITQEFPLAKESTALLLSGNNIGKTGKIVEIVPGSLRKQKLITLSTKDKKFQTTEKSIFIIGGKKPEIELFKVD